MLKVASQHQDTLTFASWPHFAEDEVEKAQEILRSGKVNYWTGEEGRLFEQEFAMFVGSKHAIALMNGTVALEAALAILEIGPGDEVITTCRTFIASASCIVMRGATPVLADVDPDTQNLTVETIKPLVNTKTKAIVVVHLAGWPCDMKAIMAFAKEHHLFVIEDCAQAHAAKYNGQYVGSFGHVAAFSFCQDKIMTTAGEGGMLTTNDESLWEKAWSLKDHGKAYKTVFHKAHPPGFRWLHESFGTNWRMTEIQSAVGRLQLRKLPSWHNSRQRHACLLSKHFQTIPGLRTPVPNNDVDHAYYKFYSFVKPELLQPGWSRDRIMQEINLAGVPCFSGSCSEIYLEEAFVNKGLAPALRLPIAKTLGETSLMFLVHPTLTEDHMQFTIDVVKDVMHRASRE